MKKSLIPVTITALLLLLCFYGCRRASENRITGMEPADTEDSQQTITLHYHERPPYSYTSDEGVEGILIDIVEEAFDRSEISYEWRKTPSSRQLKIIQDNRGRDGILGWFKNAEREKFGQYSHHIYQDSPYIALSRADNRQIDDNVSLDQLLSDQDLILDVKNGYSYGLFLDEKISLFQPRIDQATTENFQILQKIHMSRGDYFFVAPEEAGILIEESGLPRDDFRYIRFPEMPSGEKRYVLFSFNIEEETVAKLSEEIERIIGE